MTIVLIVAGVVTLIGAFASFVSAMVIGLNGIMRGGEGSASISTALFATAFFCLAASITCFYIAVGTMAGAQ